MASFSVYVVGAVDQSEGAIERLAAAMAARYGLPAAELVTRLAKGRFRVKSNLDRTTADVYAADLAKIGAQALVEEGARASQPSIPVPTIPTPSRTTTPPPTYASGLAAAFAPSDAKMDLGALGDLGGKIELSSMDDGVQARRAPAEVVTAAAPPVAAVEARPVRAPTDSAFAPPEELAENGRPAQLDIAPDEIEFRARKSSIPPVTHAAPAPQPPARQGRQSMPPSNVAKASGATSSSTSSGGIAPRPRFAIGIFLAVLLGFIPAHLVGSMREHGKYQEIIMRVRAQQATATTAPEIDALDDYRATELAAMKSARTNIAMVSMLVWLVVGAGIGFAWFRFSPRRPDSASL